MKLISQNASCSFGLLLALFESGILLFLTVTLTLLVFEAIV